MRVSVCFVSLLICLSSSVTQAGGIEEWRRGFAYSTGKAAGANYDANYPLRSQYEGGTTTVTEYRRQRVAIDGRVRFVQVPVQVERPLRGVPKYTQGERPDEYKVARSTYWNSAARHNHAILRQGERWHRDWARAWPLYSIFGPRPTTAEYYGP